jgi:hypothetical protein
MTTPAIRHAAPATWWSRIADVLHRMIVKHRPQMLRRPGTGAHSYRWTPNAPMAMARNLTAAVRAERLERAAHAALRAECDRMAALLTGVRRGRADAARFAHAVSRTKATQRQPARARFTHSSARFLNTARATRTAVRTAARETAAVAARAARQAGAPAHRHIAGVTDAYHDLAAQILARAKAYGKARAAGENSIWTTPRGLPA